MKILIATGLYPPEISGPAAYSQCLENYLPAQGIAVSVLPLSRVRAYPAFTRPIVYLFLLVREGWGMDAIYAQDPVSVGFPSAIAAFILRKKFLLKISGDYAWEQAEQSGFTETSEKFQTADVPVRAKFLRALERWVARQADAIIVPSKYLQKIVRLWGIPAKRVKLIYNGIENPGNTGSKSVLRGLINFHGKLLISVGRLMPSEGFASVIGLLPALKQNFPALKLMIVGGGPELERLENLARENGVEDEVIFTGTLPGDILLRYIRASDVCVLNTSSEELSHRILEALAVGVPVVTTAVGGNPEIIEHEKNGFLVARNDTAAMAVYIQSLLEDVPLRAKIVLAGKRTAERFSNKTMAAETAAFLKKL